MITVEPHSHGMMRILHDRYVVGFAPQTANATALIHRYYDQQTLQQITADIMALLPNVIDVKQLPPPPQRPPRARLNEFD